MQAITVFGIETRRCKLQIRCNIHCMQAITVFGIETKFDPNDRVRIEHCMQAITVFGIETHDEEHAESAAGKLHAGHYRFRY